MATENAIDISIAIWDAGECADYLRMTRPHFLREVGCAPGFPKRLPFSEDKRPKWRAQEVIDWSLGKRTFP